MSALALQIELYEEINKLLQNALNNPVEDLSKTRKLKDATCAWGVTQFVTEEKDFGIEHRALIEITKMTGVSLHVNLPHDEFIKAGVPEPRLSKIEKSGPTTTIRGDMDCRQKIIVTLHETPTNFRIVDVKSPTGLYTGDCGNYQFSIDSVFKGSIEVFEMTRYITKTMTDAINATFAERLSEALSMERLKTVSLTKENKPMSEQDTITIYRLANVIKDNVIPHLENFEDVLTAVNKKTIVKDRIDFERDGNSITLDQAADRILEGLTPLFGSITNQQSILFNYQSVLTRIRDIRLRQMLSKVVPIQIMMLDDGLVSIRAYALSYASSLNNEADIAFQDKSYLEIERLKQNVGQLLNLSAKLRLSLIKIA